VFSRFCTGVLVMLFAAPLHAQSVTPQWQLDAGTNLSFEVASIRPASPDTNITSNLDLDPSDYFRYTGGPITASGELINYILFAYKVQDRSQADFIYKQLPAWTQQAYTLRATSESKSTKDQLRVMVQTLLAERFHLKLHSETRERPVYALLIDHQPAPGITPAPDDSLCARPLDQPKPPSHSTAPPRICQLIIVQKGALREARMMDYTLDQIAGNLILASLGALDPRPVLNRTGLKGNYDFDIVFLPPQKQTGTLASEIAPEEPGATFEEALKQQAGLKLVRQTGAVPVYVIDHVEPPTEN
jgi:uncharacterized protein (TIGR03435 family)